MNREQEVAMRVMKGTLIICACAAVVGWYRIVSLDYETLATPPVEARGRMIPFVVQVGVALYVTQRVRVPHVRVFFGTYAALVCLRMATFQLFALSLQTKDYLSAVQFSVGALVSALLLVKRWEETDSQQKTGGRITGRSVLVALFVLMSSGLVGTSQQVRTVPIFHIVLMRVWSARHVAGLLVSIVVAGGGFTWIGATANKMLAAQASQAWPSTTCRVAMMSSDVRLERSPCSGTKSARVEYTYVRLVYEYEVNGRFHRSGRIDWSGHSSGRCDDRDRVEECLARYSVGTEHPCRANPEAPGDAVLNPRWTSAMWTDLAFAAFVSLLGGFAGYLSWPSKPRKPMY